MDGFIYEVVIPSILCCALVCAVVAAPIYFTNKWDCESFAQIHNTETEFTANGTCYAKFDDKWINKDRWDFYQAFKK